jgi:hypothetical protein
MKTLHSIRLNNTLSYIPTLDINSVQFNIRSRLHLQTQSSTVRFETLIAVIMKISVLRSVAPSSLI